MRIILVDGKDPYSPGDLMVFGSHADAQMYMEPNDEGDPLLHVYDEEGNWYRLLGGSLVRAGDMPKADLHRIDEMLAMEVRKRVGEPGATIGHKIDQILAFEKGWQKGRRRPLTFAWRLLMLAIVCGVLLLLLGS